MSKSKAQASIPKHDFYEGFDPELVEMTNNAYNLLQNRVETSENINNATTQRYDRFKQYDDALVPIMRQELIGIGDLLGSGLTVPLEHLGITLSLYEKVSDMTSAEVSITGQPKGEDDQTTFTEVGTPVPVFFKDFSVNMRQKAALNAGSGNFIDTTMMTTCAYNVTDLMEDALFNGRTDIVVAGNSIPGYTTFADRETVTLTGSGWATVSGRDPLKDVLALKQALVNNNFYGPYVLYIPQEYATMMDADFSDAKGDNTFRQRILSVAGIQDIRVAKNLANNNVVLVQLDRRVVDLAIAQQLSNIVMKSTPFNEAYRVMAIMIHRLKSDYDGRCGIAHGSL